MAATPLAESMASPQEPLDISPLKLSTPLHPLSPNQVHNTSRLASDRKPADAAAKTEVIPGHHKVHSRASSDVQGMVARFDNLNIKDHAELHKKDMAALRRAQMGREEAEVELKKQREEVRRLKKEQDEARDRERKVMKRVDVLMEELHRAKETHQHAQGLYEKEIRKARKEAFKSSSVVVKMQEELASTRKGLKVAQTDLQSEKLKAERKDQDVFTAKYELVSMHEKLTQALAQMKIVEEERDALKTSLKEEEVARIAAQGHIALPTSREDDEFGTPRRSPLPQPRPREPSKSREVDDLRREVEHERRQRALAEEQVDFMKMECEFQCCSCRVNESRKGGHRPRPSLMTRVAEIRPAPDSPMVDAPATVEEEMEDVPQDMHSSNNPAQTDVYSQPRASTHRARNSAASQPIAVFESEPEFDAEPEPAFAHDHHPATQPPSRDPILRPTTPSAQVARRSHSRASNRHSEMPAYADDNDCESPERGRDPTPQPETPAHVAVKTVTTTTTVPLAQSPGYSAFFAPGGMLSREEALERIRERRGRARSITGTPAKRAVSNTPRRDISAPMGTGKTPKTTGRAGVRG